jgi:hypothetical protein
MHPQVLEVAMQLDARSHLLAYLVIVERDQGSAKLVPQWMKNAGHGQAEIEKAISAARAAGLTEEDGLGSERLTDEGRIQGIEALRNIEPDRDI